MTKVPSGHVKRGASEKQASRLIKKGPLEAPRSSHKLSKPLQMAVMRPVAEIRKDNLERLVREMKTLDAVAAAGGTSSVYLSQIRRGAIDTKTGKPREMGTSIARRLEKGCHKQNGWMDGEHGLDPDVAAMYLPRSPDPAPTVGEPRPAPYRDRRAVDPSGITLRVLDVRASMGGGTARLADENVIKHMLVDEAWLRRHATFTSPQNLALVTGIGDSMEPTYTDGDPLLVDRGVTEIRLDAIYVLALNDELYIKRLQRRPDGTFTMISDNKSYEPYHITVAEREKFEVLGRVVMAWNSKRI